jgi:uncharacterized membrane protein
MIQLAIGLLWLLIGVIIVCAVIYLVFYVLDSVMGVPIPERVKQAIWLIVLILVLISLLTLIAGGNVGSMHFPKLSESGRSLAALSAKAWRYL